MLTMEMDNNPTSGDNLSGHPPPAPNLCTFDAEPSNGGPTDTRILTGSNVKRYACKLRIEFPCPRNNGLFHAQPKTREIINLLMNQDTTLKIIALDNNELVVDNLENLPTDPTEIQKFINHVRDSPPNSGPKDIIVIRIETGRPFGEIKLGIMEFLSTNRIFIRPHNWSTNRIKAIGFLVDYNPGLMWREDGKAALDQKLKFICKDTPVPEFQLITTQKGYGNDAQRITTQVAEIQCAQPDAEFLKKIFTSKQYTDYCDYRFIPEGILQVHGTALYKNILVAHNRYMNGQKTIPIENLTEDALFVLANNDMATVEVLLREGNNRHMADAKILIHRTSTKGRWLVACAAMHIEKTRKHISYVLTSVLPMLVKTNGRNDTERFYFENNPPNIVGRPVIGSDMSACFDTIATTFANPQGDGCDEIIELTDREPQAYKKRRTAVQSYAEMAQKNATKVTTQPTGTTTATLTVEKIQAVIASEIAKQLVITNANIGSKLDTLEQSVKKLDDKLAEQVDEIDVKIHLLADEQEDKMRANFATIAAAFKVEQQKGHIELAEEVTNQFAAMQTQNIQRMKVLEDKSTAALWKLQQELFPRAKNRMEIDDPATNFTPQPAVTPGSAATDTSMSVCGPDE